MAETGARVTIRADGTAAMGLGHVTRCLALAESLVDRGVQVELVSGPLPTEIVEWVGRIGVKPRTATAPSGGAEDAFDLARTRSDLAVVDGYRFGQEFFVALAQCGCRHLVVDDNGETQAVAPVMVLNQNPNASEQMYKRLDGRPRLLLGLDFVLLRHAIRNARETATESGNGSVVLVSLGGSDPCGLTVPIVKELAGTEATVRVAVGAANPRRASLAELLDGEEVALIDPNDFESALASADVAVIGAGSTMWEVAHLGIPAVAVVVAPNQVGPAAAAERLGFVRVVEGRSPHGPTRVDDIVEELLSDEAARSDMASIGRGCVDGSGADRVADAVVELLGGAP